MANPTKKTEAAAALICELLRVSGTTRKAAYTAVGISHTVFYEWMREDPGFAQEVAEAEQDFITASVKQIVTAGKKDWKALAWLLERKDPERFGTRIDLRAKELSDADILAELAAVAERAGALGGGEAEGPDPAEPEDADEARAEAHEA